MIKDDTNVTGLWTRYMATREPGCRNALVEHYAPLVRMQAARLARRFPAQVSYDELCSAGYDGLMEAVQAYDPNKNTKFETFCQQRVVGAVMDWLRTLDAQSRTVRNFEKRRYRVREELESRLGRPPSHDELAERMGVGPDRYAELSRISQLGREVHFSAMDGQHGDASREGADRAWDVGDTRQEDPSDRLARSSLTEYLTRGLSREERLVLILYYYEDLTMSEIGKVLDLSESRVSQIHKEVLRRLRKRHQTTFEPESLVA